MNERESTTPVTEAEPQARPHLRRRRPPPSLLRQILRGLVLGLILFVVWLFIQLFL